MKKSNVNPVDFDWSMYEDGYTGGHRLVKNNAIKSSNNAKVYCHESYANDDYQKYAKYFGDAVISPKDSVEGNVYKVNDIQVLNEHEVLLDSGYGMSSVVDLNKENQFFKIVGCNNMGEFVNALVNEPKFKEALLSNDIRAKVMDNNRISLSEGYHSKIEAEFMDQLVNPNASRYGYTAHILEVITGGYTVDVLGVKCFLPGSLASATPLSDFESLIGTDLIVCVVNYSVQTRNFVVSHKKYLDITLPNRVRNELSVGQSVSVKATGFSRNGMFCVIKDKDGVYTFASLMHRSTMSSDVEHDFDNDMYKKGDEFKAYIHKIIWSDDVNYRIVIGDKEPTHSTKSDERIDLESIEC